MWADQSRFGDSPRTICSATSSVKPKAKVLLSSSNISGLRNLEIYAKQFQVIGLWRAQVRISMNVLQRFHTWPKGFHTWLKGFHTWLTILLEFVVVPPS